MVSIERTTGAWSPDYTDMNNLYTHYKNTMDYLVQLVTVI